MRAISSVASRTLRAATQPRTRSLLSPRSRTSPPLPISLCLSHLQARHASSSSSSSLSHSPLHTLHLSHSAKLVPFGGYAMPVTYPSKSIRDSHLFTRTASSLFDVSHMVQHIFSGPGATSLLQRLTPSDLASLRPHRSTLTTLLSPRGTGGIVDDTVVTRLPDTDGQPRFYVVTNAGCREKDAAYFRAEMEKWAAEKGEEGEVRHEVLGTHGLVALQGPRAEEVLRRVLPAESGVDLRKLYFGQSVYAEVVPGTEPVLISRGGYTGEDGFEISIPGEELTVSVTKMLFEKGGEEVALAGLGARDSLRLEAGMCLYGHDLDESTTPVEAGLSWVIPKSRRSADAGFYGAEVIAAQLVPKSKGGKGVERRRVGLVVEGAPAREGAEIVDGQGEKIGSVTSGCPSPTLGSNIAMGYVRDGFHKAGTEVDVVVRGKKRRAVVTKMPFVPTKYHKEP